MTIQERLRLQFEQSYDKYKDDARIEAADLIDTLTAENAKLRSFLREQASLPNPECNCAEQAAELLAAEGGEMTNDLRRWLLRRRSDTLTAENAVLREAIKDAKRWIEARDRQVARFTAENARLREAIKDAMRAMTQRDQYDILSAALSTTDTQGKRE